MALTSVPPMRIPSVHATEGSTIVYTSMLIDAVGEKTQFVLQVPKTGNVAKLMFRTVAHTTNGTADVRLETVDLATGSASGTLFGTNTNGSQSVTAANTVYTPALTAAAAVTEGDLVAVVVEVPAASTLQTNIATIASSQVAQIFPYSGLFTASWTKDTGPPVVALEYDDGSYGFIAGAQPYSLYAITAYNSSTPSYDERGNRFTLPFTCRARAVYLYADIDEAADIVLYDSDGTTVLRTISLDKDTRGLTSARLLYHHFSSAVTLNASSTYRLVLKPTTTTNISLAGFSVASSAIMTGAIDGGAEIYFTSRVDAGAWSDDSLSRAFIGLIVDQIDLGGGGGGLIGPGGIRGGFQ